MPIEQNRKKKPHIYNQLIVNKGVKNTQWGEMHSPFIKQCKNWTHAEKWNWISLTPLTKWTQNESVLNIRPGTVKVLEQNIRKKLLNNSLGNNFLDITSEAQTPKANLKVSAQQRNNQQITYRMREIFYKPSIKLKVNIQNI